MRTVVLHQLPASFSSSESADVKAIKIEPTKTFTLGRCELTGITDKRCSRDHLKVWLDVEADELVLQQLGTNPSCVQVNNEETLLTKNSVKRLPLNSKSFNERDSTNIYLIKKDYLFGYNLKIINSANGVSPNKLSIPSVTKRKASSSLDEFITKKPKNNEINGTWTEIEKMVYFFSTPAIKPSDKIAAFDMDGTLITTASGAKWPKNKDDWKFLYPEVPSKLKKLASDGFKLVIFTNQGSISNGTLKPSDIQEKLVKIMERVDVPMQAIIAGSKLGKFRKPAPGMWDYICECNGSTTISITDSVYVGDAAGRTANWQPGKKKDFACSDRLFALNIGLPFATPEAFFKGEKEGVYEMPDFNPVKALEVSNLLEPASASLKLGKQEMVVMVGFPGSGKSFFSTQYLPGYEHINRDKLGSWQKCVAKADQCLKTGSSVVIDNTNPDIESRSRYLELAKKYKVPARCFLMTTSYKQARHNEKYRQLTDAKHKPINDMVVNSYKSKFKEPELSEGFLELVRVNVVTKFETEQQKELYALYLLDK